MSRLAGKRALVTGGAGGIGLATARLFLEQGARVALLDADAAAVAAVADELAAVSGEVPAFACDIADEGAVAAALDGVVGRLGGLDILVNNAAVRERLRLAEASAASWSRIFTVNVVGSGNCTRAALPSLRRSGRGAIVNVASVFALVGRAGMGQYDATKAAMVSSTRVLAVEEARHGVRVNAVCPGSVLTSFTLGRAADRGMTETELIAGGYYPCPLDRWGRPEEIAHPIAWLASDEASFVTGAVLPVDGGLSAQ